MKLLGRDTQRQLPEVLRSCQVSKDFHREMEVTLRH